VAEYWQAVVDHRAAIEASGELARRRQFRVGEELREIVARRLEQRARELATGERWEELQLEVADHRLDPWTAADEMLDGIGG
jgi:LAO/AO transport system kinase